MQIAGFVSFTLQYEKKVAHLSSSESVAQGSSSPQALQLSLSQSLILYCSSFGSETVSGTFQTRYSYLDSCCIFCGLFKKKKK